MSDKIYVGIEVGLLVCEVCIFVMFFVVIVVDFGNSIIFGIFVIFIVILINGGSIFVY